MPLVEKCIDAAIVDGDIKSSTIDKPKEYWFIHHLAMAMNLCLMADEPAFEYGGTKEEMAEQMLMFCLRGIGMPVEVIARYYEPDELEVFFSGLYQ